MTWWRIWQGSRRPGLCKYCKRPVVWMISSNNVTLPFDPDFRRLRAERHPNNGAYFDVISSDHLHFVTCPNQPARHAR